MAARIRKNDLVEVTAGKDKGVRGKVTRVQESKSRVWVEKVNMIKRHQRGVAGFRESEIVEKEAPIHISNVMLVDPQQSRPTRVGFKLVPDVSEEEAARLTAEGMKIPTRKVRVAKLSGAVIEDQS